MKIRQSLSSAKCWKRLFAAVFIIFSASAQGNPIWSDEFDSGSSPDGNFWSYDLGAGGWGNSELQEYTSDSANVRVENGSLIIQVQEQTLKGIRKHFTSARVKTENKLTVQYGTIEARIRMPDVADGLWPAFWTLGNNFSQVGWPDCGELDIAELGSATAISDNLVRRRVSSTAHWEHQGSHASYGLSHDAESDLNGDFHVYRMEWTPDFVDTYIDDQWIWSIDISSQSCTDCTEFHQPHFLILNLAVGGSFPELYRSSEITAPMPATYEIDYVRIYDNGFTQIGGSGLGGGSSEMHIDSIVPGSTGGGPNKRATADVTVVDEFGSPVSGANVTGTFSGSHNQTVTATTDAAGVASLVTSTRSRNVGFEFCVGDVVKSSMNYDSTANVETCDSW